MKNAFLKILKYTVVFMLIINLYKIFIQNPLFHNDYSSGYLIVMTILKVSLFLVTLALLKYEKIKVSNFNKNKYLLLIVAVVIVLRLYQNVLSESTTLKMDIDYFKLSFYSLNNLSIGFFEEFYFRLFVFSLLCSFYKTSLFKISIITSALFAIVHLSNLLLNSYAFNDVLFQVMFAFATGLFLQLIFINVKNIYIPALIHFFIDFNSSFSEKFFNVSPSEINDTGFDYTTFGIVLLFIILALIFAYFNLRKKEANYFKIENTLTVIST
jgi:membrane protease YdiL (CAAX protease family)